MLISIFVIWQDFSNIPKLLTILSRFSENNYMKMVFCHSTRYGSMLKYGWSDIENETKSDVGLLKLQSFDTKSVSDVETTLKLHSTTLMRRCFNVVLTLVNTIAYFVHYTYIESSPASDDYRFVKVWIVFIQLDDKIFLLYINNQLLISSAYCSSTYCNTKWH